ncbi:MAG: MaoC family dehydratase [Acetobacteraceae bacterium]
MAEPYHFEDFAAGQSFASRTRAVGAEEIIAFAREFDPQPMHVDRETAQALFGGLIASGWHTAALSMRLMIDGGLPPLAPGSVGLGVERLSWPEPVRPGDTLAIEANILSVRPSRSRPDRGLVSVLTTTRNQKGRVVLEMTSTILVPRRPA